MPPTLHRLCLGALLLLGAPVFAFDGAAAAAVAAVAIDTASAALTVSGKVEHVLKLDTIGVRAYPADQVVTLTLPARHPGAKASLVRGVRLKAMLDRAKLVVDDHNTPKKTVVIATGRDGYAVVFSWSELFNSKSGDNVLVLFERDDQALPDTEGPLALVAAGDMQTGPRHVKWLERIEVKQIID